MEDKQEVVANFAAALATSIAAEQSPSYLCCYKRPPDLLRRTGRLVLFLLLQGATRLFSEFFDFLPPQSENSTSRRDLPLDVGPLFESKEQ